MLSMLDLIKDSILKESEKSTGYNIQSNIKTREGLVMGRALPGTALMGKHSL